MFIAIICNDLNNGISYKGQLPWDIPEDLASFYELTKGAHVIMGRKTAESIFALKGHYLKNRTNVVLTSNRSLVNVGNVIYVHGIPECIEVCAGKKTFVIGGREIYEAFYKLDLISEVYHTRIRHQYPTDLKYDFVLDKKFIVSEDTYFSKKGMVEVVNTHYRLYSVAEEEAFNDLIRNVLDKGKLSGNRTGKDALFLFGAQLRFDLRNGKFPLMTSRYVSLKYIFEELMFMLQGLTDSKLLEQKGINIWKPNTSREFLDSQGLQHLQVGDMGATYGFNMRNFGATYINCRTDYKEGFDQLKFIISEIKNNPNSRRIIMNLWDPKQLNKCVLPPCVYGYQFQVSDGELSCIMTQRSSDIVVAGHWNIAVGALLVVLLANVCGLTPGELIWNPGNIHIYEPNTEAAYIQVKRRLYEFPILKVKTGKQESTVDKILCRLLDFSYNDLQLEGYKYGAAIKTVIN